ncbi:porin family protein [Vibrio pectenicida]|uniref:Porin family protein n=1 Tax=Vibrio pectenicida TaxID=62763 RepID=A0A7Y3ZVH5_9VIBR|nr:outer membrane beta-barrel protein [Vibrio pectenicida]NOH69857.1 porin family protein [Vibrio pectenicida]
MKKVVLAALVTSASFQAVGSEYVSDGWYIGADVIGTTFEAEGSDSSPSSTSGAIAVGYDFKLSDSVVLGIEAEYADYGKFDFVVEDYQNDVYSLDIKALSFYAKPKYFVKESSFYFGVLAGISFYSAEREVTVSNVDFWGYTIDEVTYRDNETQNETEFVYGLEAGYAFNSHLLLNVGYRMGDLKNYEHDTWYAGLDYKF